MPISETGRQAGDISAQDTNSKLETCPKIILRVKGKRNSVTTPLQDNSGPFPLHSLPQWSGSGMGGELLIYDSETQ